MLRRIEDMLGAVAVFLAAALIAMAPFVLYHAGKIAFNEDKYQASKEAR